MTQFKVDVGGVKDMAARLKGVKDEFDSIEDVASGNGDAIGFDEAAGKLEEFGSNWSDKRHEISKMIENVAGYAQGAADAYSHTEGELASAISGSGEEAGPAK